MSAAQTDITVPTLRGACEAVLLFHGGGPWEDKQRLRWLAITGSEEATTKVLCDTVRTAMEAAQ